MRQVKPAKKFIKEFNHLKNIQQLKAIDKIEQFKSGKCDKQLKVHKLTGQYKDEWAFSVDRKLRIIYSVVNDTVELCLLEHVGTHDQSL
jgi:addiction module RelE/StbE family toxin